MMSRLYTQLTLAVISTHVAFILTFTTLKKMRFTHAQTEEERLLKWLTVVKEVPLVQDMAAKLNTLSEITINPSDTLVVSYPKSGTTWVSEIVYNIQNNIITSRQGQEVGAVGSRLNLDERVPYLEWIYPVVRQINAMSLPRTLKSHLPVQLLPAQCLANMKIVYVWRNPRDVAVSYYHFTKMINLVGYKGTFPDFFQLFTDGKVAYGDWCSHVEGYWNESHRGNVFVLSYEQLTKNPVEVIKRLAKFLEKPITDDQAMIIAARCSFNSMKKNKHTNYDWLNDLDFKNHDTPFLRNGKVGDWRNYFTEDMLASSSQMVQLGVKDKLLRDSIVYVLPQNRG